MRREILEKNKEEEEENTELFENLDSMDVSYEVDSLKVYLREIAAIELLSPEEELNLFKQIKGENSKSAEERIITANLRLVCYVAKSYTNQGLDYEDLIQYGNIGLIKAVEKYDYQKGFRFASYAIWWIRQAITRALHDYGRVVRIPIYTHEIIKDMKQAQSILMTKLSRNPTENEVAEFLGLSDKKIRELMVYAQEIISLDLPVGGDESEITISDIIADASMENPEESIEVKELQYNINEVLDMLSEREQDVIKMRFGFTGNRVSTLGEIAEKYEISCERTRQIEKNILKKLVVPCEKLQLREFLA